MQTMSALCRISGDLNMTVPVEGVTPAEALVLMHVHDPATLDVFENATLDADVDIARAKVDERARLQGKYPKHLKLIEGLFPGRTAADVPDRFDDLRDVPLTVVAQAKRERAREVSEQAVVRVEEDGDTFVAVRPAVAQEATQQDVRKALLGSPKKKG